MKLTLMMVGQTDQKYLREGVDLYAARLKHYIDFKLEYIPDVKKSRNMTIEQQRIKEGEFILSKKTPYKEMHLFDEKGKLMTSVEFAEFLQKKMASGIKELMFVVGGPYGFSDDVNQQALSSVSLSKMTFSHQLARLLCVEQFYRAFTILKGEPYHHE